MKHFKSIAIAGSVIALAGTLSACDPAELELTSSESTGESTDVSVGSSYEPSGDSDELLEGLEVADKFGSMDGYDRENFPHWEAATSDLGWDSEVEGCDVRWATLWRDGHDLVWDDQESCIMGEPGYWEDQYGYIDPDTGEMEEYLNSGDPSEFDVDHIVALAAGHRSGLDGADEETLKQFANDPLNVEVSDASANRSKGDQTADTYLPPGEFRCEYVDRYIQVKDKYDLVVIQAEKDRLSDTLAECAE